MGLIIAVISPPVSLDATNWKRIYLENTGTVILQCRSDVDVYIANAANPGAVYFTIKAGTGLTLGIKMPNFELYVRAASGPVDLEILYLTPE
jgi:hypothetical protein